MAISERDWDEMIIALGKEMRRLRGGIEAEEEEGDFVKEIREKLGRKKPSQGEISGKRRREITHYLKKALEEDAGDE
jgi:hypothetical protein